MEVRSKRQKWLRIPRQIKKDNVRDGLTDIWEFLHRDSPLLYQSNQTRLLEQS
jgi:hypothetical protein